MNKSAKKTTAEIFELVDKYLDTGEYIISKHAQKRGKERQIPHLHVIQALRSSKRRHEARKDKYDEAILDWNYSVISKDIDERRLRIIISLSDCMLIITVMVLSKGK